MNNHLRLLEQDVRGKVISFDLQKVLSTPHGDNMLLGYSRKLAVYNLTLYESGTGSVKCFLWDETFAKRGSNEISTGLYDAIRKEDRAGTERLTLVCDSCPGQNKNRTVLFMMYHAMLRAVGTKTLGLLFLIPGHTYMPVDSAHSTIENSVRNAVIYAPSQWKTVIGLARKDPAKGPYEVLDLPTVMSFKEVCESRIQLSIKDADGEKVKWSAIRNVRIDRDNPAKVMFRYKLEDPWNNFVIKPRRGRPTLEDLPPPAYKSKLKISTAKFKDLMALVDRGVIPATFHNEYKRLQPSSAVDDVLNSDDEAQDNGGDDDDNQECV